MANTKMTAGELGKVSYSGAEGRIRARARLCLPDRENPDPITGAFPPGQIVAVEATGPSSEAALAALHRAADKRRARVASAHQATASSTIAEWALSSIAATLASGDLRPTSGYLYTRHVERHLKPSKLGAMVASRVQITDIESYVADMARIGAPTARLGRAVVKRAMMAAEAAKAITANSNPGRMAVAVKTKAKAKTATLDRTKALGADDRVALAWAVARDQRARDLDVRDLVLAGLAIGGRLGEVLALRWQDVTLLADGGAVVLINATVTRTATGLERTAPKTLASVRPVPLAPRIAALLRRRAAMFRVQIDPATHSGSLVGHVGAAECPCDGCRLVFPAPGRWEVPGEGSKLREVGATTKSLRGVFDRAGFEWLSFHGLRRSAATALIGSHGVATAAEFLGHTDPSTTLRAYAGRTGIKSTGL